MIKSPVEWRILFLSRKTTDSWKDGGKIMNWGCRFCVSCILVFLVQSIGVSQTWILRNDQESDFVLLIKSSTADEPARYELKRGGTPVPIALGIDPHVVETAKANGDQQETAIYENLNRRASEFRLLGQLRSPVKDSKGNNVRMPDGELLYAAMEDYPLSAKYNGTLMNLRRSRWQSGNWWIDLEQKRGPSDIELRNVQYVPTDTGYYVYAEWKYRGRPSNARNRIILRYNPAREQEILGNYCGLENGQMRGWRTKWIKALRQ